MLDISSFDNDYGLGKEKITKKKKEEEDDDDDHFYFYLVNVVLW